MFLLFSLDISVFCQVRPFAAAVIVVAVALIISIINSFTAVTKALSVTSTSDIIAIGPNVFCHN